MALEVLVVDDEADIRELVSGVLEDEGYAVRTAADSTQRSRRSRSGGRRWSCSTSGCRARGSTGSQLLQEIKRRDPTMPVLMISGHGNLDTAVAAVREGAVDFIEKPFEAERLIYLVDRATETERLRRENETPAPAGRPRGAAPRQLGRDQHGPRDLEAGRADRQPGADHRARPGSARKSPRG